MEAVGRRIDKRAITPAQLGVLWAKYTEFRRSQLAPSTIARDYRKVASLLSRMPPELSTSVEIRDWLVATYAGETARRCVQQFNACCEWAFDSDLLDRSPFTGMNRQFRKVTHNSNTWTAFEPEERDAIIRRFDECQPYYSPWVKFLFWTGCRPEEAAALTWEHIKPDLSVIHFVVAAPIGCRVQSTKNRKDRLFPVNSRLKQLLMSVHQDDRGALVLPGKEGGYFEYHNFQNRHWKPLVSDLVAEGQVFRYMSQYHARHTWITLALEHMTVNDVAYYSGNSPNIIYRHYASRSRGQEMPEF